MGEMYAHLKRRALEAMTKRKLCIGKEPGCQVKARVVLAAIADIEDLNTRLAAAEVELVDCRKRGGFPQPYVHEAALRVVADERDALRKRLDEAVGVVRMLVAAKDHKERCGKDCVYRVMRDRAWQNARTFLVSLAQDQQPMTEADQTKDALDGR